MNLAFQEESEIAVIRFSKINAWSFLILASLFPDPVNFLTKEVLARPAPLFSCYFRRIY